MKSADEDSYTKGHAERQQRRLRVALKFVRESNACQLSYPDAELIHTAREPSPHLLGAAVRKTQLFDKERCRAEDQPLMDTSRMHVFSNTSRGRVFMVRIDGEDFIIKWVKPTDSRRPFSVSRDIPDSEAVAEMVFSTAVSAVSIAGSYPFFCSTYCTFGCKLDLNNTENNITKSKVTTINSNRSMIPPSSQKGQLSLGICSIQENIRFTTDNVICSNKNDIILHSGITTLAMCAIFVLNHRLGIVHNDLHLDNIRWEATNARIFAVRWRGIWRLVQSAFVPKLIDWDRSCDRPQSGICSLMALKMHRSSAASPMGDICQFFPRLFASDEWECDDCIPIGSLIMSYLVGRRRGSPDQIIAAITLMQLFIASLSRSSKRLDHLFFSSGRFNAASPRLHDFIVLGMMNRNSFDLFDTYQQMDNLMALWPSSSHPPIGVPHVIL